MISMVVILFISCIALVSFLLAMLLKTILGICAGWENAFDRVENLVKYVGIAYLGMLAIFLVRVLYMTGGIWFVILWGVILSVGSYLAVTFGGLVLSIAMLIGSIILTIVVSISEFFYRGIDRLFINLLERIMLTIGIQEEVTADGNSFEKGGIRAR